MNEKHNKQITATVVIGVLFTLMFAALAAMYIFVREFPVVIRIGYGGLMIAMAVGMIHIMKARIAEIRKGENDDLSNY